MKRIIISILILIALLLVSALALPWLFRDKVKEAAIDALNEQINGEVSLGDFSLSFFTHFPNLELALKEVAVAAGEEEPTDTIMYAGMVSASVSLPSLWKDQIKIGRIFMDDVRLYLETDTSGTANWEKLIPEEYPDEEAESSQESTGAFDLDISDFRIQNSRIVYKDASLGLKLIASGFNHHLSGNLTADRTLLNTHTETDELLVEYDGIPFLNNVHFVYEAGIDADLNNFIFTLKDNNLRINDLALSAEGSVSLLDQGYNMILSFNSPQNSFKSLISLLPQLYTESFSSLETVGTFEISGNIKGIYSDSDLPSFQLNLQVNDGMFRDPSLPESVSDVQMNAVVTNPGHDFDNTVLDISRFSANLGQLPVNAGLRLRTPVSDPEVTLSLDIRGDLASLTRSYPMPEVDSAGGIVDANIRLQGRMSDLEQERYEKFRALGHIELNHIFISATGFPEPVTISSALMNFAPEYLDLVRFNSHINKSRINLSGKVENYLAYALDDALLSGNISVNAGTLNLNDWLTEEIPETEEQGEVAGEESYLTELPGNMDFLINVRADTVIYDKALLTQVSGEAHLKNGVITFGPLSAGLLGGEITCSGKFAPASDTAFVRLSTRVENIDIAEAATTFENFGKYFPIARKAAGRLSTSLDFGTRLGADLMPVMTTFTGNGILNTTTLTFDNPQILQSINQLSGNMLPANPQTSPARLSFKITGGVLELNPVDFTLEGIKGKLTGQTSADLNLDYLLTLIYPASKINIPSLSAPLAALSGDAPVPVAFKISGPSSSPKVSLDTDFTLKNLSSALGGSAAQVIEEKKEQVKEEARKKADRIIADAEKQAAKVREEAKRQAGAIRQEARKQADALKKEAENQAKKIEDEARGKGFIAETAAKKAADKVRSEADKKAGQLISAADQKANQLEQEANKQSEAIIQNAQKQADQVLKEGK
ncbi:MAG: AsmA-like C-terminal region-containing protein [Bacteroidales bacterium]